KEWSFGVDHLILRWEIYFMVLADAAESVRDTIGFEYYLASSSGWTKVEVGDRVLLKVTPWKGVVRFGKKCKLAPRYVGPFKILKRFKLVDYRLGLPKELSSVHDTFHVSNMKKCLADANLHVPLNEIKIEKTLCFVEEPVEIMNREVKSLKCSRIPLVKVRWNLTDGPEFTWEREYYMKSKYPQLFVDRVDKDEPLEHEASDKEVDSDLESTASSKPKWKKIAKADPDRASRNCPCYVIVTQVINNVNNANGGNGGNGRNNGCTYKGFMACNPKEYDGKGGAIALTRWIKKMENVIDNSGYAENQKVKYSNSSFMNKDLTWWNTQVQVRGREAAIRMSWTDFKALLVEELCPSNEMEKLESEFWNHKMVGANHTGYTDRFHELAKLVPHLFTPESSRIKRYIAGLAPGIRGMLRATQPAIIQSTILRAGILTYEAVSCGTLTKGNEKIKGVEESSKHGNGRNDDKRKVSKGFMAGTTHRNEYAGSLPKCAKCLAHHSKDKPCLVCFNCQKPGHIAWNCHSPIKQVALINAVSGGYEPGTCYKCGSYEHYRNTCSKLNLAPGQVGNRLTIEGN
ncbi:putative reverse transcriptase domain-containing protein, partial [Tanacetum coccineum]